MLVTLLQIGQVVTAVDVDGVVSVVLRADTVEAEIQIGLVQLELLFKLGNKTSTKLCSRGHDDLKIEPRIDENER